MKILADALAILESGLRVPARDLAPGARVLAVRDPASCGTFLTATVRSSAVAGEFPRVELRVKGQRKHVLADTGVSIGLVAAHASSLLRDSRIATIRRIPEPLAPVDWPDHEVILLAQLIGDGSFLMGKPMRYTTSSEENSAAVTAAARAFGCEVKRYAGRRTWHQLLISGNGNRWHPAGVNRWLRDLGIFGQRSHQKRFPRGLFALTTERLALFLRHLWATDGTISLRRTSIGGDAIAYATNSPGLADDLVTLLLRFDIVARLSEAAKSGYRPGIIVLVSGAENQRRFLERIGAFGPKHSAAREFAQSLVGVKPNTNVDTVPPEFFDRIAELAAGKPELGLLRNKLRDIPGLPGRRLLTSRSMLATCGESLGDTLSCQRAASDIFWDRVVEAKPDGVGAAVDLEIDPPDAAIVADRMLCTEVM